MIPDSDKAEIQKAYEGWGTDIAPLGFTPLTKVVSGESLGTPWTKDSYLHFKFQIVSDGRHPTESVFGPDTGNLTLNFRVNPKGFDRSYKKIVDRVQTRGGWVEYHGGDELDTINVNGTTGAFIDDNGLIVNIAQGRYDTRTWKEYNKLINLFRNNGSLFDRRGLIYDTGFVVLHYDAGVYSGLFDSLEVKEDISSPYQYEYSFSFVVQKTLYSFKNNISTSHQGYRYTQT